MGKKVDRVLLPKAGKGQANALAAVKAFPVGTIPSVIGKDLEEQVGRPVQGLVIKVDEAKKVLKDAQKALEDKKIDSITLTVGLSGKDMVFVAVGSGAWEKFGVLVAGYTDIVAKQKAPQKGAVVNLDPKDKTISDAAKVMEKKLNTTAVMKKDAGKALEGLTGDIVLLAHGDEDKTSSGQIYGKDFAGKSPEWIVKLLTQNPDTKKRLTPEYSGTVYIDGCFTAQGGAMKNYAMQVWNGLKAAGIKKAQVKGNLGAAATQADGTETVNPTIESEACKKEIAQLRKMADEATKICTTRIQQIIQECKKAGTDFKVNKEYLVLKAKDAEITRKYNTQRAAIVAKYPVDVKDLVGQFGISTIN
jgi:hypothetical protein